MKEKRLAFPQGQIVSLGEPSFFFHLFPPTFGEPMGKTMSAFRVFSLLQLISASLGLSAVIKTKRRGGRQKLFFPTPHVKIYRSPVIFLFSGKILCGVGMLGEKEGKPQPPNNEFISALCGFLLLFYQHGPVASMKNKGTSDRNSFM